MAQTSVASCKVAKSAAPRVYRSLGRPLLVARHLSRQSLTDHRTMASSDKTIGILTIGLGGNNGVTLLAGYIANRNGLEWETQKERIAANWYGCITQIPPRGQHGGVGFKGRFPLANVANAALGGWDVRPTPLGQALYESRVLEYDLVRQVRDEMDSCPVFTTAVLSARRSMPRRRTL